jgi:hypothetical protein
MNKANAGVIIVVPSPGRRFSQETTAAWDFDGRVLLHRDVPDRDIDRACDFCGHQTAEVRCDYRRKEKNGVQCDRRMCRSCAVHVPALNDFDLCVPCAREAGVVFDVNDERRARAVERLGQRPQGYHIIRGT